MNSSTSNNKLTDSRIDSQQYVTNAENSKIYICGHGSNFVLYTDFCACITILTLNYC